jgi:WD40 repeat protein
MLMLCVRWTPVAGAATDAEKLTAIQKGLGYLYKGQHDAGNWGSEGYEQAATGAAVFALLSQEDKWAGNAALYSTAVDRGTAFLVKTASTIEVSTRLDGVNICPGRAGVCNGVYWYGNANAAFTTGLVAPAIAAYGARAGVNTVATTSGPLAGLTWGQIAQGITNAFAASQSTNGERNRAGGWSSFIPGNGDSDLSGTYWAVLSFLNNETLGAVTPDAVKSDLRVWLATVQDASGAACHQAGVEPCNHAATGSWLLAARFSGYELADPHVQSALFFLNTNRSMTAKEATRSNFGNPQDMWSVYAGLQTTIGLNASTYISNFFTGCGETASDLPGLPSGKIPCNWSEDYSHWAVANQKEDGGWGGASDSAAIIAAAFYLNIVGATPVPPKAVQMSDISTLKLPEPSSQIRPLAAAAGTSSAPAARSAQEVQSANILLRLRQRNRKGVTAIAVNGDGSAIASASASKRIVIWDATTGLQRLLLPASPSLPTGLAFAPAGGTLSSVGRDSLVRVWDSANGRELAKLSAHESAIRTIAASPDGVLLASAGEETRIMLWSLTNRKLSKILFGSRDFVNVLSFSPDSRLLASASEDSRILIFDVTTGKSLFTLRGHSGPLDALAFSPDGKVLASGGQDTEIRLWDSARGQQIRVLRGHSGPVRAIAFSPDGRFIATGGEDSRIRLWNAATGALDRTFISLTGPVNVLTFDPKGRFLVSAGDDGEVTLWNAAAGSKLRTILAP